MGCRNCRHALRDVCKVLRGTSVLWCPRCGTLKLETRDAGRDPTEPDVDWWQPLGACPLWRGMEILRRVAGLLDADSSRDCDEKLPDILLAVEEFLRDWDPERKEMRESAT